MRPDRLRGRSRLLLLLPLLLAACIADREEESGRDLRPGELLPAFSVRMDDGTTLDDRMLAGRISLLAFFHTGCPDCRQVLPALQRLCDHPEAAAAGIFCISREEGPDEVAAYWRANGLTLPYSAQEDRSVYRLFARSGIPRIYLVAPDRRIRRIFTDQPPATFDELLAALEELRAEAGR